MRVDIRVEVGHLVLIIELEDNLQLFLSSGCCVELLCY